MASFAGHLKSLLEGRGLSGRAFAQLVGANQSYVSKVLRGTRPAPDADLERWAHALGLTPVEQRRFLLLADFEHVPARLKPLFTYLVRQSRGHMRQGGIAVDESADVAELACLLIEKRAELWSAKFGSRRAKQHQ